MLLGVDEEFTAVLDNFADWDRIREVHVEDVSRTTSRVARCQIVASVYDGSTWCRRQVT